MYHSERTSPVGRYLVTGNNQAELRYFLGEMDAQMAVDIYHELYADLYYADLNQLTPSHIKRLKKLRYQLEKAIELGRIPPKRNANGNVVEAYTLPSIDVFRERFGKYEFVRDNDYIAICYCHNTVAVYIEGDVRKTICPNEAEMNRELLDELWHHV